MSGEPEQEYFSDGITEDIITALSKHRSLLVIARNSTFAFKGHDRDVRQVGLDLGADYLVEGSVRKIGKRMRVTAQLVETEGGRHVWADRYDRNVEDMFADAGRYHCRHRGSDRARDRDSRARPLGAQAAA